uniref:WhiB family transcriptional regulator n=1 Tax=Nocardia suismassiliense TaxID=2077092 RepID=UPI003F493FC8
MTAAFVPTESFTAFAELAAGDDEDWQERALCAQTDPEAFFPEKGGSTEGAKRICQACEVREQCLQYALDHQERFGIWGGLSERERRQLRITPVNNAPASGDAATPSEVRAA